MPIMKNRIVFVTLLLFLAVGATVRPAFATRHETRSDSLVFSIDDATGAYALDDGELHFAGRLAGGATRVTGAAAELRFALAPGIEASVAPAPGDTRALLFTWKVIGGNPAAATIAFP